MRCKFKNITDLDKVEHLVNTYNEFVEEWNKRERGLGGEQLPWYDQDWCKISTWIIGRINRRGVFFSINNEEKLTWTRKQGRYDHKPYVFHVTKVYQLHSRGFKLFKGGMSFLRNKIDPNKILTAKELSEPEPKK